MTASTDTYLSLSKLGQESVLYSSKPIKTEAFDVRATVENVVSVTSGSDETWMGLVFSFFEFSQATQYMAFVFETGLNNTRCRLIWRNNGLGAGRDDFVTLATGTLSFSATVNTKYTVRVVKRGRRIQCWVTPMTNATFYTPVIDYTWARSDVASAGGYTDEAPADGLCKVGVLGWIRPHGFRIHAVDAESTVLVASDATGFGNMPSSGYVKIDDEVIQYGARTPGSPSVVAMDAQHSFGKSGIEYWLQSNETWEGKPLGYWYDVDPFWCSGAPPGLPPKPPTGWVESPHQSKFAHTWPSSGSSLDYWEDGNTDDGDGRWYHFKTWLAVKMANPQSPSGYQDVRGYGAVFKGGSNPTMHWLIDNCSDITVADPSSGQHGRETHLGVVGSTIDGVPYHGLHCAYSGHGTQYDGVWQAPYFVDGAETAHIGPCLYGTDVAPMTRGTQGTVASGHSEGYVYVWTDDQIRLYEFEYYDFEDDFSTERALRRICTLAGVPSQRVAFDHLFNKSYSLTGTGDNTWAGQTYVYTASPGDLAHLLDIDLSFKATVGGWLGSTPAGVAVLLRSSSTTWASSRTAMVGISSIDASTIRVAASYWENGVQQSGWYSIQPTELFASPFDVRIVATGSFYTVYINGATVASFHLATAADTHDSTQCNIGFAARGTGKTVLIENACAPDLFEWRDALYISNNEDALAAAGRAIADRPIYHYAKQISGALEAIKFTTVPYRAAVPGDSSYVENNVTHYPFTNTVLSDAENPDDTSVATFVRVDADNAIIERVYAARLTDAGLIYQAASYPYASRTVAVATIDRVLRRALETTTGRDLSAPAHFALEIEDQFEVVYNLPDGSSEGMTLVVNSLGYTLGLAEASMELSARLMDSTYGYISQPDALPSRPTPTICES